MNSFFNRVGPVLCGAMLLFAFHTADAATRPGRVAVTGVKGAAEYQVRGEVAWHQLKIGMVLAEGISIRTKQGGRADLVFTTGAIARITQNSSISIDKLVEEVNGLPQPGKRPVGRTEITVLDGQLMTEVAKQTPGSIFRVHTPHGDIDVKGTQLAVAYDPKTGKITLALLKGSVTVRLGGQDIVMTEGTQISWTYNPTTGQYSVDPTTPAVPGLDYATFLREFTDSGIRDLVINSTNPVNLDAVLQDAFAYLGITGQSIIVIPNINNPVIVSPTLPASP